MKICVFSTQNLEILAFFTPFGPTQKNFFFFLKSLDLTNVLVPTFWKSNKNWLFDSNSIKTFNFSWFYPIGNLLQGGVPLGVRGGGEFFFFLIFHDILSKFRQKKWPISGYTPLNIFVYRWRFLCKITCATPIPLTLAVGVCERREPNFK